MLSDNFFSYILTNYHLLGSQASLIKYLNLLFINGRDMMNQKIKEIQQKVSLSIHFETIDSPKNLLFISCSFVNKAKNDRETFILDIHELPSISWNSVYDSICLTISSFKLEKRIIAISIDYGIHDNKNR